MNGHCDWLGYHRVPGAIGAGDDGICTLVYAKKGLAMNWTALIFWTLLIGGLLATIVGLVLTFVRRSLRASE